MNTPLVSIIIPMYNQKADYLRACLDGALNQTYPNIEIIISDNHSTNNAPQILEEYAKKNSRVKIVKPEIHLNINGNFMFAASHSQGEYISFLSSDDILLPECISKVIQPLIDNKDLSYSFCENIIINVNGNRLSPVRNLKMPTGIYSKREIAMKMYNHSGYWIIGGVIRNELYKRIGFVKDIIASDWIMAFQLLKFGDVAYINDALSEIRFYEREGEALAEYSNRHIIHHKQRIEKHNHIIDDIELLNTIGIAKKTAISYRNDEILIAVTTLIRNYHTKLINNKYVDDVFELYKKSQNGFNFVILTRFYKFKIALLYTYFLGLMRRLKKSFK